VNLSDLVTNSLLSFEPIAFERKVTLQSAIAQDVVILGDSERIRRLVAILFDNAVKYSGVIGDPGNLDDIGESYAADSIDSAGNLCNLGSMSVSLVQTATHALLTVQNSGEPIPAEELGHIFDRFYRIDKSRSTGDSAGYGLGLSIAKQIVEDHGAKIHVTSAKEEGTRFAVQFKKNKA
jgi:signal transduction histidine kinase